jgi:hypothetical protein
MLLPIRALPWTDVLALGSRGTGVAAVMGLMEPAELDGARARSRPRPGPGPGSRAVGAAGRAGAVIGPVVREHPRERRRRSRGRREGQVRMPVLVDVAAPTRPGWTGGMGDGHRAAQTRHDRHGRNRHGRNRDGDARHRDGRRTGGQRVPASGRGGR